MRPLPAAWLVTLALVCGSAGATPAQERPLRLGIYHPWPRLCLADEPTQRDLRVLRLAFGVERLPGERLAWPWFLRTWPVSPRAGDAEAPRGMAVTVDTAALWGQPAYRLQGAHPKLPVPEAADRLAPWRDWVAARLPGAHTAEAYGPAHLLAPPPARDPFFASRLAGSAVLPFDLGRNGTGPTDLCRRWPAGVTLRPAEPPLAYTLRIGGDGETGAPGTTFELSAYRDRAELWRDYFRGRLDALLLEAADFDGRLERYRASQLGAWGVMLGTQQIVLRVHPSFAGSLGIDGRMALSLALPREQLAQVDGPGRFAAPTAMLAPVLAPGAVAPAEALAWDTLRARRLWLERSPEQRTVGELRLAVLAHPMLERLAGRIQAQWNRTLNLNLRVQAWPFDQFSRVLERGEADLVLDVVDLDDGSLQDLWLGALRAARVPLGAPTPKALQQWETALRRDQPFLPLLSNVHAVLLRRDAPEGLLQRVCPGCVPAESPRHLAPEPVEREDPQG